MLGRSLTRTRLPTLKRAGVLSAFLAAFVAFFSFMAGLHLRNLFQQLGERNMVLVDEHPRRGPNPAPVVGHAEIERITQIVIGPPAPFLGAPYAPPAEHLACHVSVEFPLFFFLFLVLDRDIALAAHIVGRGHVGAVQRTGHLVVSILRVIRCGLHKAYEVLLLAMLAA